MMHIFINNLLLYLSHVICKTDVFYFAKSTFPRSYSFLIAPNRRRITRRQYMHHITIDVSMGAGRAHSSTHACSLSCS